MFFSKQKQKKKRLSVALFLLQTTGKVIAVGAGRTLDNGEKLAPAVKEGDQVLFDKYAGNEVEYDGEKYLVVHEKDLVAIVE